MTLFDSMASQRLWKAASTTWKVTDVTLSVLGWGFIGSAVLRTGDSWINGPRQVKIDMSPGKKQVVVIPIALTGAKVVTFTNHDVTHPDYKQVSYFWRPTEFFIEKEDGKTVVVST